MLGAVGKKARRNPGPTSSEGKDTSSQNATKHGGRANRLIVKGERQEDYDALRKKWIDEYRPENELEEDLLEDIVRCKWFLVRAERNVMKAEARLAEMEPEEWTDADHKFLQLMLRYQTTRERSFQRAWRAFEQLRKDRIGEAASILRLRNAIDNTEPEEEEGTDPSSPAPASQAKTNSTAMDRAGRLLDRGVNGDRRAG
jgi:hypothetical protein